MRKVLIFFTGVFGFILIFSVSAIISYFMYPETKQTAANADGDAAVKMDFGDNEPVSGSSELTIVTPALDKTKTIITYGSAADVVGGGEEYAEDDTYDDTYAEIEEDDEAEAAKSENVQSAPQTTIVEQTAASGAAAEPEPEAEPDVEAEPEVEWGIELPPNTTVVTPTLDESVQLSDTGL